MTMFPHFIELSNKSIGKFTINTQHIIYVGKELSTVVVKISSGQKIAVEQDYDYIIDLIQSKSAYIPRLK